MWEFDPWMSIMPLISFFGVICMIPFMYIIIVYLVFISSIAKGLAMSRLGGVITTKKCYFVDLIIMVLSTFE